MRSLLAALALLGLASNALSADATESLRAGATLMPVKVYSLDDDRKVLKAFEGLRVADVSDGMDFVGLHDIGLVNPDDPSAVEGHRQLHASHHRHRRHRALRAHAAAAGGQAHRGRVRQVGGRLLQPAHARTLRAAAARRQRGGDRGSAGDRRRLHRLQQHHELEAARRGWRHHQQHLRAIPTRSSRRRCRCISSTWAAAYARVATRSSPSTGPSCSAACW